MSVRIASVFIALISLCGCITEPVPADNEERIGVGDLLPEFRITLSDGSDITTEDLKGRVSLIIFFNTGCVDCQRELPVIQSIFEAEGEDINCICIAREEGESQIASYWQSNGLSMPYSAQPDRNVYNLFATVGIPRTFIADSDMRVIAAYGPETSLSFAELLSKLDSDKSYCQISD